MVRICLLLLLSLALCSLPAPGRCAERSAAFAGWLAGLRQEALAAGISPTTLDPALATIHEPLPQVVQRDRNQPEQREPFASYVVARTGGERLVRGRQMLRRYPTWLGRVERHYGVQRRYLVALWGLESNYGAASGRVPVLQALATLAYDHRRNAYFRRELLTALQLLDAGHASLDQLQGSWAGAMGQCQFMPSSFQSFAVDTDGDGRRDIWRSVPDVLASIANYLARNGWHGDQIWGRPVRLPADPRQLPAGLETRLSLARWQKLGVRRIDGRALPRRDIEASLLLPAGPDGPTYLVYDNFRVLLSWNHANAFAVTVGTLAERLAAPE